jgi:hypothetical protein
MELWWQQLGTFEQLLWGVSLLFSLLFILQSAFSFLGGDDAVAVGDVDDAIGSDDGVGSSFFTLRNFIVFFTLFGWAGLAAYKAGWGEPAAVLTGALAGGAMVAVMMWLLKKAGELRHSGTLDLKNAVGSMGTTYLLIPARRTGSGKVSIQVQGALRELEALTDEADPIPTGARITVVGLADPRTLLVTRNS